jgi:hypothetical protein
VFGRDLLADPSLTSGFLALFALDETRPFECVGTPAECHEALRMVAADPAWSSHHVVAALVAVVGRAPGDFAWTHLDDPHHVPDGLLSLLVP